MGDEFYCCLKLVSGEEIFSLISIDENNDDPIIILQNPVIMKISQIHGNAIVKIKPWLEIPDDDFYILKYDKIMTMTEINDNMIIDLYKKYLNHDTSNSDIKVKIDNQMGYISSVEDARKNLENIFKLS